MKNVIVSILLLVCSIFIIGCNFSKNIKNENKINLSSSNSIEDEIKNIHWKVKEDNYGKKIIEGTFQNPFNKEIESLGLKCIFYKNGIKVENQYIYKSKISPNSEINISIEEKEYFNDYEIKFHDYSLIEKFNAI